MIKEDSQMTLLDGVRMLDAENVDARDEEKLGPMFRREHWVHTGGLGSFYATNSNRASNWIHHYSLKTKYQYKEWKYKKSTQPQKSTVQASAGKNVHTFFTMVILIDYMPHKVTFRGANFLQWRAWFLLRKHRVTVSAVCLFW